MNFINPAVRGSREQGVAAVEFALVFSLLLLFIYGSATFGSVMYTQQAVSRAAEDGARALASFNGPLTVSNITAVQGVVHDSLSSSLVGPVEFWNAQSQRKAWLQSNLTVSVNASGLVLVTYPYSRSRVLNLSESWVPINIIGRARIVL